MGRPTGSVLGPLIFTFYISPTHVIMRSHGVGDHEYPDDTQGYIGFRLCDGGVDQDRAVCQMAHCLKDFNNYLTISMLKTTSTSNCACTCTLPMQQHLSYEQRIIEASRKALYQIRCIASVRRYIDERSTCNMPLCVLLGISPSRLLQLVAVRCSTMHP